MNKLIKSCRLLTYFNFNDLHFTTDKAEKQLTMFLLINLTDVCYTNLLNF